MPSTASISGSGVWATPPRCTRIVTPDRSIGRPSAHTRPIPSISPSHKATAKLSE